MFSYTSGTTGDPKGAMISHRSMMGAALGIDYMNLGLTNNDISISYLPYAHIFEQCILIVSMPDGARHGYYSGNPLTLIDDI